MEHDNSLDEILMDREFYFSWLKIYKADKKLMDAALATADKLIRANESEMGLEYMHLVSSHLTHILNTCHELAAHQRKWNLES